MDVRTLIETTLTGMGYELVDLVAAQRGVLQLFIDKPADDSLRSSINVDDCARVSNQLGNVFLVENIDYARLEVSSPGVDRPLTRPADFVRFAGERVKVRLRIPIDNSRRMAGILVGQSEGVLKLLINDIETDVPMTHVEKVRLDPEF